MAIIPSVLIKKIILFAANVDVKITDRCKFSYDYSGIDLRHLSSFALINKFAYSIIDKIRMATNEEYMLMKNVEDGKIWTVGWFFEAYARFIDYITIFEPSDTEFVAIVDKFRENIHPPDRRPNEDFWFYLDGNCHFAFNNKTHTEQFIKGKDTKQILSYIDKKIRTIDEIRPYEFCYHIINTIAPTFDENDRAMVRKILQIHVDIRGNSENVMECILQNIELAPIIKGRCIYLSRDLTRYKKILAFMDKKTIWNCAALHGDKLTLEDAKTLRELTGDDILGSEMYRYMDNLCGNVVLFDKFRRAGFNLPLLMTKRNDRLPLGGHFVSIMPFAEDLCNDKINQSEFLYILNNNTFDEYIIYNVDIIIKNCEFFYKFCRQFNIKCNCALLPNYVIPALIPYYDYYCKLSRKNIYTLFMETKYEFAAVRYVLENCKYNKRILLKLSNQCYRQLILDA